MLGSKSTSGNVFILAHGYEFNDLNRKGVCSGLILRKSKELIKQINNLFNVRTPIWLFYHSYFLPSIIEIPHNK